MGNSHTVLHKELKAQYKSQASDPQYQAIAIQAKLLQDPEAIKKIQATEREDHAKLFDAADADKSGFLDKKETTELVKELVYCKKKYAVKQMQESVKQMKQMGPMGEALAQPFKEIIHKLEAWTPNEAEMLEEMWQKFDENHDGKVSKQELLDHWDEAMKPLEEDLAKLMGPPGDGDVQCVQQ